MDKLLRKGRKFCPKCKRKGLGYANHPHASGYKDYDHASCRYCNAKFKIKDRSADSGSAAQENLK